jgi:hypothetical protein
MDNTSLQKRKYDFEIMYLKNKCFAAYIDYTHMLAHAIKNKPIR